MTKQTTNQHTPGPWTIEGLWRDTKGDYGVFDKTAIIAHVYPRSEATPETRKANARLIAAAPELLEALEALLEHEGERNTDGIGLEHYSDDLERAKDSARAAIAKARGV